MLPKFVLHEGQCGDKKDHSLGGQIHRAVARYLGQIIVWRPMGMRKQLLKV
ncbi:MAG: hypothetical protein KA914_10645 [Ottowia sp.]|nr:hypothetical protein [Ottowia sp.]